jgi:hypothetical protein
LWQILHLKPNMINLTKFTYFYTNAIRFFLTSDHSICTLVGFDLTTPSSSHIAGGRRSYHQTTPPGSIFNFAINFEWLFLDDKSNNLNRCYKLFQARAEWISSAAFSSTEDRCPITSDWRSSRWRQQVENQTVVYIHTRRVARCFSVQHAQTEKYTKWP